jgi:signal transduction histidine kinase/HAMP domain-containing protein
MTIFLLSGWIVIAILMSVLVGIDSTRSLKRQYFELGEHNVIAGAEFVEMVLDKAVSDQLFDLEEVLRGNLAPLPKRSNCIPQEYSSPSGNYLKQYLRTPFESFQSREEVYYTYCIGKDGYIAVHTDPHYEDTLGEKPNQEHYEGTTHTQVHDTYSKKIKLGGYEYYEFASPVYVQGHFWGEFRLGIHESVIKNAVIEQMIQVLLGSLVACLLLSLFIYYTVKSSLQPVLEFSTVVQAMSGGNLSIRCHYDRDDELGDLGRSFNEMADKLTERNRQLHQKAETLREENEMRQQIEKELEEHRNSLETLVEQRTLEVTSANEELINTNRELERENLQRMRIEKELQARTVQLDNRIVQLSCLHRVGELLDQARYSLRYVLNIIVDIVEQALRNQGDFSVKIIINGCMAHSEEFEDSPSNVEIPVSTEHENMGAILVSCSTNSQKVATREQERSIRRLLNTSEVFLYDLAARLGTAYMRVQAEAAADTLRRRIEFVLGATNTCLSILDIEKNVVYVDPQWQKNHGDFKSKKCWEYFACRSEKCTRCMIESEDLEDSRRMSEQTLDDKIYQVTTMPFYDENGTPLIAQVRTDVTNQKELERELSQAQKLESIGQLAAGIAHEINTPIQYIGDNTRFIQDAFVEIDRLLTLFLELLEHHESGHLPDEDCVKARQMIEETDVDFLTQEIPEAIEQMLDGVGRVAEIVHAMKNFSHPGSQHMQAIDLNKSIRDTITISRNEWKYVAEVQTEFDEALPLTMCLPGELNQVILNLIVNAAHAIEEKLGGNTLEKGTIFISTKHVDHRAVVSIGDNGIGIPEKIREKIFDPFFTTKNVGKGTGQGLSVAYSIIVDKHRGTIEVETEEGKGATFTIEIPIDGKDVEATSDGSGSEAKPLLPDA